MRIHETIFDGCEVLTENSVTRVTVLHHSASLVTPSSYPSDGIFNLHQRTIMDSFSCILFLRQLHLEYVLFYQFYVKITTFFDQEKFISTAPLLYVDVETFGGNWCENDVKTSKSSYWRHAWESSYTPRVRRHFLAPVGFMEIRVRYARIVQT